MSIEKTTSELEEEKRRLELEVEIKRLREELTRPSIPYYPEPYYPRPWYPTYPIWPIHPEITYWYCESK